MNATIIMAGLMGSRSYGTEQPDSDTDYMRIVVPEPSYYIGLGQWGSQGSREYTVDDDTVEVKEYEVRKAIKLFANFNPNAVQLLWLDRYESLASDGKTILLNRNMFSSRKAYHAFTGYAYSQMCKIEAGTAPTGRMGQKRKDLRAKYGYDTKFAMHAVRLMRMCNEFLEDPSKLNVRRPDAAQLLNIRNGQFSLYDVKEMAQVEFDRAAALLPKSNLPDEPDWAGIDNLTCEVIWNSFRTR